MGLSSGFSLSHLDAVGMIISENIPGQKWVKEEGKDLPVPGKAVVAVMAEEDLILDILLLGEGEGLLVVVAKPKSFIFNCEHIQEVVSCFV